MSFTFKELQAGMEDAHKEGWKAAIEAAAGVLRDEAGEGGQAVTPEERARKILAEMVPGQSVVDLIADAFQEADNEIRDLEIEVSKLTDRLAFWTSVAHELNDQRMAALKALPASATEGAA